MRLSPGKQLGAYKIVGHLGSGGMGDVYRAADTRLGREVALKVLPEKFAADPDLMTRFEQEARAASALNHANIVTVHDVGRFENITFLVMELLDGTSLRDLVSGGPLPNRRLIDVAGQIAQGLAAAHDKAILHRDLKPENIFVCRDGTAKILDFGLAKLAAPRGEVGSEVATLDLPSALTEPGVILGTAGYMSPEQAAGRALDFRSDQFSLGSILYEMATGVQAFKRETAAQTLAAIIEDEPKPLESLNPKAPAPFCWIVERCLAKDPEGRFASTRDLARDLDGLKRHLSAITSAVAPPSLRRSRRRWRPAAWLALLATVAVGIGYLAARMRPRLPEPEFERLTFRRGFIPAARFLPDGDTVIYSATWEGGKVRLFSVRRQSPESQILNLPDASILGVSRSGELALQLNDHLLDSDVGRGTLARVASVGEAPREILDEVQWADWSPEGSAFAVVLDAGGTNRLEFPIGHTLYATPGWVSHPRVSPTGDLVAFLDHPSQADDGGRVAVVNPAGQRKTLTGTWTSVEGLAWSPRGEIWFTASERGNDRALWAVNREGRLRLVFRTPGSLKLHDVSARGEALLSQDDYRAGVICRASPDEPERDLSWLDLTIATDLSQDGKRLLFDESGEGGGSEYSVYIRDTTGQSPPTKLCRGLSTALSPNGQAVLVILGGRERSGEPHPSGQLTIVPTGTGQPRTLPRGDIEVYHWAGWFPDGRRIAFAGSTAGKGIRIFVQSLEGGGPTPITPQGMGNTGVTVSPDGQWITAMGSDNIAKIYSSDGKESKPFSGLESGDEPVRWSADGKSIYVFRLSQGRAKVFRLELASQRLSLWKELMPLDPTGITDIPSVVVTPDGRAYAYSYGRTLSSLFLVKGLM
jgi:serine/threonine protein kinase/Tol biopolymer transport system component